ncbi:MAG: serine/threonine-protein kinase [Planctomycetota bacterium]
MAARFVRPVRSQVVMSHPDPNPPGEKPLQGESLLREATEVDGFKVLPPAVLYARIGEGGMGAVFRGRHCQLDIDVAVKCLLPSMSAARPELVKRFTREARLAASLTHQNLVRVMDVQQHGDLHYLVMEYVAGENAADRVRRKGALGEAEALRIVLGACRGLAEAHRRGIVHRDVKPENVLIATDGRVKLADLGIARVVAKEAHGSDISVAGRVVGTPAYMPPEQWDTTEVTPAADVWSIGAVLYFLLSGEHAIPSGSYLEMAQRVRDEPFPELPPGAAIREPVVAMLHRCVQRDPGDRYSDAGALLSVLQPLVDEDDASLAHTVEAGAPSGRGTAMVTPPPRETVLKVKLEIGGSAVAEDPSAGQETVRQERPGATAATRASVAPVGGATEPTHTRAACSTSPAADRRSKPAPASPHRPRWPWILLVVALLAASYAAYEWGRDDRVHPFEGTPMRPIDDELPGELGRGR